MKRSVRLAWWALALAAFGLLAVVWILTRVPYIPWPAQRQAENFCDLMANGHVEEAYALTDPHSEVGRSLDSFKQAVKREWLDHGGRPNSARRLRQVFPFQSQANHWCRAVLGKNPEIPQISFDFYLQNIPFEVRLKYQGRQKWPVIYFQSHAL
jgi:hypothetical protein